MLEFVAADLNLRSRSARPLVGCSRLLLSVRFVEVSTVSVASDARPVQPRMLSVAGCGSSAVLIALTISDPSASSRPAVTKNRSGGVEVTS